MAKRNVLVDLAFVVDATASTESVFQSLRDRVIDTAFDFHAQNRRVDDQYAVVIYRDPVDRPEDKNEFMDFTPSLEEVEEYLAKVESYGGRDDPEDWVGALDIALHQISWRGGKKCIFWITDACAHGSEFSEEKVDHHDDQAPLLRNLVVEMARENFYFVGINIMKGADRGCAKTLAAIREIYDREGGKSFIVEEFKPVWDRDLYDGDGWPPEVMVRFQETVAASLRRQLGTMGGVAADDDAT